ncbi:flagellar export protein FliJ [Selenihalanaerobacter shriftii]|uniref:Flagellar FliJ protein n=1 Tax=Selenihalanaerobacter shriftii TaxID=142842 RepID=A0A1T4MB13_9FIRM|nr:flagellar export protein FliJ [Selenihalanaerobacter shriftii]SJZ64142.1 flagellar FliJ protein [Selenihalanaerobacter shriftii]
MKKFKFKLEKILDYRQQEEDMIQQKLAKIKEELNKAETQLNNLVNNKKQNQAELKEKEIKGIDVQQAMVYRNYIETLKVKITNQQQTVTEIRERSTKCRRKLLEKRKECKMLTKLKERKISEYQKGFLRKEQKQIDELATNNFNRQREEIEAVI